MHDWLQQIIDDPAIGRIIAALKPRERTVAEGAWGSTAHLITGAVAYRTRKPMLLVVAHLDDADEAVEDLALFGDVEAVQFPALEMMPGESNVSVELLSDRLALVSRIAEGRQPPVIVAPVQALMQGVPPPEAMGGLIRDLFRGQELPQDQLIEWLAASGYERVDAIEEAGQFAVRGGIVDVYPPGGAAAARIDYFGDQIDEIAEIDLDSMGSGAKLDRLRLVGAAVDKAVDADHTTSLWSMLREETIVVLHETMEIAEQSRGYFERLTDARGIYPPKVVQQALDKFAVLEVNQFAAPGMAEHRVPLPVRSLVNFDTDSATSAKELGDLVTGKLTGEPHRVIVLCQREAERERLIEILTEHVPEQVSAIQMQIGYLYRGFMWGEDGAKPQAAERPVALVPHHELLHRYGTRRRIRRVGAGRAIDTFLDIEPGDFVVHTHHGIARFRNMRVMKRAPGSEGDLGEEYLTLEFAERALLHVPASEIELVHKYVGGAGRPPLSKLGGNRWSRQKEAVAEGVKQLAAELLRVQAARASLPGIRYPDDTTWMRQFEAEFPYQETEDQLAAIVEIKKDMIGTRPMDRLICGDVGYGKTELAMRAAFKAVDAGKQVAVLCPTTVLSEQHERTFRERIADYPVTIEALNRFKSAPQIRQTLQSLSEGAVDIVIGTHRILSDDVYFKDLGLVIVDEEQRFGVEHKNKLMRFRVTVDVLTMSATPIPRTLHMALLGLRDISSLSTPPADRRAVVTEVMPFERGRIRQAILRELNRGGQCFFVHNRVHSIHAVAADLGTLVPEARIVVGHGQMTGRELEDVMLKFVRGEADVLLCTTIIESGIDIPTANTIFIADADRFGLAEMHQLRGRVGRYKHRAYCYLLLPETRALTDVAQRRLRAIEEYSMLGAGFKIAMRDMEIRGVGNILGPEQSGHIASVGYELYCRLLEDATRRLKHESTAVPFETHIELKVSGHLPKRYIPSDKHRMDGYRRITRAPDLESLQRVEKELVDAYGELPQAAKVMFAMSEIRIALSVLRVEGLKLDGPDLIFATKHPQHLSPLLGRAPGTVRLVDQPTPEKAGTVFYRPPPHFLKDAATMLAVLQKLLGPALRKSEKVKEPAIST